MNATIRVARPDDAPGIAAIYAPFVRSSPITFEIDVPTVLAMLQEGMARQGIA